MRQAVLVSVLLIVSFFYTRPFFTEGFFQTHDGEWAVIRLAEMQRELRDGQIPARWSDYLNHGFGYPLFHYTYPFPFYIGAILTKFHIGLVTTVKILFAGSVFLSAIGMYLLARKLTDSFGAVLAAVFYTASPFRLVDLYVRGSLGESMSLAIFPWLFYASYLFILAPTRFRIVAASILLGVLLLTHNIMALLIIPFWIVFLFVVMLSHGKDIRVYAWKYILPLLLLGISLSSFFIIPATVEKHLILLSKIPLANVQENFIPLINFINSPWEFSGKPSFQLGLSTIIAAVFGIGSVFFGSKALRKKYVYLSIFCLLSVLSMIFLSNALSFRLWGFPPLSWVDFPWRFMTPLIFILSISGSLLTVRKFSKVAGVLLALFAIVLTLPYASVHNRINKPDSYYQTNDATTTSMDELLPVWVLDKPQKRYLEKVEVEKGFGAVSNISYSSKGMSFQVAGETPTVIRINTIFFPGWQFRVKGENLPISYDQSDGLIRISMKQGNAQVIGAFVDTPVRYVANRISQIAVFVVGILILIEVFDIIKRRIHIYE